MLENLALIYLFIGLAHWAAHLLQCRECKIVLYNNFELALDACIHLLGWPFKLWAYIREESQIEKSKNRNLKLILMNL